MMAVMRSPVAVYTKICEGSLAMDYFPHEFDATVEHHDLGSYRYTVIFLDPDIAAKLPFDQHPRLRISGELNDHPFTGAWQPSSGRWYLMLGQPLLKATGLSVDCVATIRFRVEPQDEVDVPAELKRAVDANGDAAQRWAALTPGKQRALAHRVLSAKTATTQGKRIADVLGWLVSGETDLRRLGKI
jgi:Bacteriocin-protection, YdeI or OmpD-Associated/Domain of unknown function (DUF1905)